MNQPQKPNPYLQGNIPPVSQQHGLPQHAGNPYTKSQTPQKTTGNAKQTLWLVAGIGGGALVLIAILAVVLVLVLRSQSEAEKEKQAELTRQHQRDHQFDSRLSSIEKAAENKNRQGNIDASKSVALDKKDLEPFFEQLRLSAKQGNNGKLLDLFDMDEFTNRVRSLTNAAAARKMDWSGFKRGLSTGLRQAGSQLAAQMANDEIQVGKTAFDGTYAVVHVRFHYFENSASQKCKFWLVKKKSGWKFFDYEEVESGHQMSRAMSSVVSNVAVDPNAMASLNELQKNGQRLNEAKMALLAGDYTKTRRSLSGIDTRKLPEVLLSAYWIVKSIMELHTENYEQALKDSREIVKHNREAHIRYFLEAQAEYFLSNYDQSIDLCNKYQQEVGPDANALRTIGLCQKEKGKLKDAMQSFRKALEDNPYDYESLYELSLILDQSEYPEIIRHFEKIPNRENVGTILIDAFTHHERKDLVDLLSKELDR